MAAGRTVHTQKNRVNRQGQYVYGNVDKAVIRATETNECSEEKEECKQTGQPKPKKGSGYEPCLCNISCGGSNICTDPVRELCADAVKNYKSFKRSKFLAEGACRFEGAE